MNRDVEFELLRQLRPLVETMRAFQVAWFGKHDKRDLRKARALESRVDAHLRRMKTIERNPGLFHEDPKAEAVEFTGFNRSPDRVVQYMRLTDAERAAVQVDLARINERLKGG